MSDDDLKPSVAELLERILFPFGKHNPKNRSVRASKEWHSYAQILAYFIIRELVKAGHAQPSISRRSVVVRVVRQVLKLKQVPDAQMVTASAVGRFLERWDETSGLTPRGISRLTTKASRIICGLNREIGLCHLSDSEFALRVGPHHDGENCKDCQTGRLY
jgi:hypothetical protein